MRKLSRRQLILSLIFPVGITVWVISMYIPAFVIFGYVPVYAKWAYPICLVCCGMIPIILTITLGADTGQYLLPRILISACALAFSSMAAEFLSENSQMVIAFLMLMFTVLSALYFYKIRPTKFSEWIIIFLSNPCMVRLIIYFAQSLARE